MCVIALCVLVWGNPESYDRSSTVKTSKGKTVTICKSNNIWICSVKVFLFGFFMFHSPTRWKQSPWCCLVWKNKKFTTSKLIYLHEKFYFYEVCANLPTNRMFYICYYDKMEISGLFEDVHVKVLPINEWKCSCTSPKIWKNV